MRKSRRQIVNRIFEAIGAGLVVLDLVVFFGVYRPLGDKLDVEARRQDELRQSIRKLQVRVELLKKFQAALPEVAKQLADFTSNRIPPRREAYSSADHLVHKLADASGVKLSTLGFKLEPDHKEPLEKLALEIKAQGPYAGLVKFAHALETADEFLLVRDFEFTPGDNAPISLRLTADLYLTP